MTHIKYKGKIVATIYSNEEKINEEQTVENYILSTILSNSQYDNVDFEIVLNAEQDYESIAEIFKDNSKEAFKALMYLEMPTDIFDDKVLLEKYLDTAYNLYIETDIPISPQELGVCVLLAYDHKEDFDINEVEENINFGINEVLTYGV